MKAIITVALAAIVALASGCASTGGIRIGKTTYKVRLPIAVAVQAHATAYPYEYPYTGKYWYPIDGNTAAERAQYRSTEQAYGLKPSGKKP